MEEGERHEGPHLTEQRERNQREAVQQRGEQMGAYGELKHDEVLVPGAEERDEAEHRVRLGQQGEQEQSGQIQERQIPAGWFRLYQEQLQGQ